jgi:hypothetical protein
MEIVLQWLDDLDDLVYAAALTSEPTRRALLGVGLAASLVSASAIGAEAAAVPAWLPVPLVGLAMGSVAAWSALAAAALAGRTFRRAPAAARPA